MILPTRDEVIKGLAEDYAKRASVLSLKFEDAYDRYVKRCDDDCEDGVCKLWSNLPNGIISVLQLREKQNGKGKCDTSN